MTDTRLKWLEVIMRGPEGPVLTAALGACLVLLILHNCSVVTLPQNMLWVPWSIGSFSFLLLTSRGAILAHGAWKKRPCPFSRLTQDQQQFLIQQVRTGSTQMKTEHLYHLNWFKELKRLNYIDSGAYYSYISAKGWKEVERHLAHRK